MCFDLLGALLTGEMASPRISQFLERVNDSPGSYLLYAYWPVQSPQTRYLLIGVLYSGRIFPSPQLIRSQYNLREPLHTRNYSNLNYSNPKPPSHISRLSLPPDRPQCFSVWPCLVWWFSSWKLSAAIYLVNGSHLLICWPHYWTKIKPIF